MAVLFLQVVEVLIALVNPYAKCPYFNNSFVIQQYIFRHQDCQLQLLNNTSWT